MVFLLIKKSLYTYAMNKHLISSLVLLNVTDDMGIILISNIDDLSVYNISCSTILKKL